MRKLTRDLLVVLAPVVILMSVLPAFYSNRLLLFNFIVFATLAQGINLIYGFTGYLPFGYVGFFGAGAYGFSLLVMHLHAPPLVALGGSALAALLVAALLTPLLRLSGAYFAIASLAASLALLQIVANPRLEAITRGPYEVSLSGVFDPTLAYAVGLAILSGAIAVVVWLRNSRFGLALQAIRDDAISAAMAGVDVVRARVVAWMLSALIAGLIGGAFAWYVSVFYAETVFAGYYTNFALVFALFGGVNTAAGPLLGVALLYGTYNVIGISTPQYFQLIYGLLIMALLLFLPNGMVSLLRRRGIHVP